MGVPLPPLMRFCCAVLAGAFVLSGGHALAQAPVPVTPAPPLTTADLVKANRNNLVFVQGPEGAGSGFIARLAGANYLFTNAHVAIHVKDAGFKTLDGTQVQDGKASVAVGHDIFCMLVAQGGKPLEIMDHVDENASIGDDVVVLGNAEGAGVINTIAGKIVGVGPDLVEVDAPFVPGNSGSPIIHLKTGKVIGVATYLIVKQYDTSTRQAIREPRIRRFGYRVDSVKAWQPVNWNTFLAQAAELKSIEQLTTDLEKFLMDLARNHRVTPGMHTNPAIKMQLDWWQASNRRGSLGSRDAATADQNFIAGLKNISQADIAAARQNLSYDYFIRKLTEQQQQRKGITDVFDEILQQMRNVH